MAERQTGTLVESVTVIATNCPSIEGTKSPFTTDVALTFRAGIDVEIISENPRAVKVQYVASPEMKYVFETSIKNVKRNDKRK
jgi:hypothetical protein